MKLCYVFPEHMKHRIKRLVPTCCQVIRQRIDPHINAVLLVNLDRPRNTRKRATHTQILRAL